MTATACPMLDATIREDMVLCALDALRMDGKAITAADLRARYAFSENACLLYAADAIAAASRIFYSEPEGN